MSLKSLSVSLYTVGWLCAIEEEELAALGMLDAKHDSPTPCPISQNGYTYGEICDHNVVIVKLPAGQTGQAGASRTAVLFSESFPTMKIYLFVGIGGGMPSNYYDNTDCQGSKRPIHLGDVVVASPKQTGVHAIVEYDRGRETTNGFESFGLVGHPITELVIAVDKVESTWKDGGSPFHDHLVRLSPEKLRERRVNYDFCKFERPDSSHDMLFKSEYKHVDKDDTTCSQCSKDHIIERDPSDLPAFHRGPIASGNKVIQDAEKRDKLSDKYQHAICFDMEAAGVLLETNCLVIRGISDYADSHKSYRWHNYAAATAAAFARQLLYDMPPHNLQQVRAKRLSTQLPVAQASSSVAGPATTPSTIAEAPGNSAPGRPQIELPVAPPQRQRNDASTNSSNAARASTPANSHAHRSGGNLQRTHKNDPKIPGN